MAASAGMGFRGELHFLRGLMVQESLKQTGVLGCWCDRDGGWGSRRGSVGAEAQRLDQSLLDRQLVGPWLSKQYYLLPGFLPFVSSLLLKK